MFSTVESVVNDTTYQNWYTTSVASVLNATGFTNFTNSDVKEKSDYLIPVIASVCAVIFVVLCGLVFYRIITTHRLNNLRQRLVSLRRFDPALRGRKSTYGPTVQTPDGFPTEDPLMMYSTQETQFRDPSIPGGR